MSEYTKGKWGFDSEILWVNHPGEQEIHTGNYEIYSEDGETMVANVNGQIPEGKANARLMAAAPELIEALKAITTVDWRKWEDGMNTKDNFIAWARNVGTLAIAKAEATHA